MTSKEMQKVKKDTTTPLSALVKHFSSFYGDQGATLAQMLNPDPEDRPSPQECLDWRIFSRPRLTPR
jgi:hypothetical protein